MYTKPSWALDCIANVINTPASDHSGQPWEAPIHKTAEEQWRHKNIFTNSLQNNLPETTPSYRLHEFYIRY